MKKYYLKEDVEFERLEKFDYLEYNKEESDIKYFKFNGLVIIRVFKDRHIDIQKPIGKEFMIIDIKNMIKDLIKTNLVEERDE